MKKSALAIFITYIWTKTLYGLVVTPYKSVRKVSRDKLLLPVVFSPLYALFGFLLVGRVISYLFEIAGLKREFIAMILSTGLLSILLWQALLIYLLVSFLFALRKS